MIDADRGLVENGSVSPLFETLYLLVCVTLLSVFSIFGFYYYLNRDPDKKSNFNLMCTGKAVDVSNFDSMKSITLILALTLPLLMILITMFIAILYFLRSRGMSKKVPPIIGNYRRNILSLREMFAYFVIFFVNFYLNSFLLKFHMQFGLSIDMIRIYGFSSNLVFNNLLEGIILPIFILWNLNDQMPDSILKVEDKYKSTKPSVYNLGYQNLEPRRMYGNMDSLHSKDKVYVNSTNNFSFLNATNKNPSIVDLPSVV